MSWLKCADTHLDRDHFDRDVARAARGFQALGVKPGAGIAICMRNEIAFLIATCAASRIGAWCVGINWHSTPSELRYVLADCGPRVIVIHADLLEVIGDDLPSNLHVIAVEPSRAVRAAYPSISRVRATSGGMVWDEWLSRYDDDAPALASLPNIVTYTSGTTGRAKGVRRPEFGPETLAVLDRTLGQAFGMGEFDPDPGAPAVTAVLGPLYHMSPANHASFSIRTAASIVVYPRFDAERLLADIERYRITHLNMVPIMFGRLLRLPAEVRHRHDLTSLRYVVHAAAPCAPEVKRAMIAWWGPIISEFFGSTEMGTITHCSSAEWLERPGTVGRAISGARLSILDDEGLPLPAGTPGEIAGCMPGLGEFEYIGDPEKRASVDRNGLIAPGDIGWCDEDGYLFLCARKSDMIISGGVNIYPAEIEAALQNVPGVADCAVFGIPDEEFGEAICAVIQPAAGADQSADFIRSALGGMIARYKLPKVIEFRAELPREDSGKIFKRRLRDPWWEGVGRSI